MYSMYVCTIHYHAPTLYLNGFPIWVSYVYTMCVLHTFCGVPAAVIFLDEALLEVEEWGSSAEGTLPFDCPMW